MSRFKKGLIILAGLIICGLIAWSLFQSSLRQELAAISISQPDLSRIPDGTYIDEYEMAPVLVRLEVVVADKSLRSINLLQHDNGLGQSAEAIIDSVIDHQSLAVDTVSGATVSSKCILKAIEQALQP